MTASQHDPLIERLRAEVASWELQICPGAANPEAVNRNINVSRRVALLNEAIAALAATAAGGGWADDEVQRAAVEFCAGTSVNFENLGPVGQATCLSDMRRVLTAARPSGEGELSQDELFAGMRELSRRIEICGASPELTHAVILSSDIGAAIGNKWNLADAYAANRVRAVLPTKPEATDGVA